MEFTLKRIQENNRETAGELYIDGKFICYTLEPARHENKVLGKTRIPAGRYPIYLRRTGSKAHEYIMKYGYMGVPEIGEVKGFTDILIHIGNTKEHTRGCILVGDRLIFDHIEGKPRFKVYFSRIAFKKLMKKYQLRLDELIYITIL